MGNLYSPTCRERPFEKVFEQRFDYGFGQYTEAKMGRKSTLTGHRKGTLQTRPRLFGQSQKGNSRKPGFRGFAFLGNLVAGEEGSRNLKPRYLFALALGSAPD